MRDRNKDVRSNEQKYRKLYIILLIYSSTPDNRIGREIDMNINDMVEVTLTEHGKKILDGHIRDLENKLGIDCKILFKYDEHGKFSASLWELMNLFGEHIYNGAKQVFENNEIMVR